MKYRMIVSLQTLLKGAEVLILSLVLNYLIISFVIIPVLTAQCSLQMLPRKYNHSQRKENMYLCLVHLKQSGIIPVWTHHFCCRLLLDVCFYVSCPDMFKISFGSSSVGIGWSLSSSPTSPCHHLYQLCLIFSPPPPCVLKTCSPALLWHFVWCGAVFLLCFWSLVVSTGIVLLSMSPVICSPAPLIFRV